MGWVDPLAAAGFAYMTTGAALLPDLDMENTMASNTYGTASRVVVRHTLVPAFGGHRKRSHNHVWGPLMFSGVSVLAVALPGSPLGALVIALATGLVLAALHVARLLRTTAVVRGVVSVGVFALALGSGWAPGWWLPLAVWVGAMTHLAGDSQTVKLMREAIWLSQGKNRRR